MHKLCFDLSIFEEETKAILQFIFLHKNTSPPNIKFAHCINVAHGCIIVLILFLVFIRG